VAILSDHPDGTLLTVWLVAGASRDAIGGVHGDALKVRVTAPAERGRANRAVAALLEARCGSPVELVAGGTGRRKVLLLRGMHREEARRVLAL